MKPGKFFGSLLVALIIADIACDLLQFQGALISGFLYATAATAVIGASLMIVKQNMVPYVGKRLGGALLTTFVIATATFVLLRFLPGGPFDSEKALPPEIKANIEAKYHLNDPIYKQFSSYLSGIMVGDLGESYKYVGRGVTEIILETIPASFKLGFYALLLSYAIGIPLGLFAATKHNTWMDSGAMFIAMCGVALPSFVVAPILILIFSYWLDILPPALWDSPLHYILPVVTLGIRPAAIIARLTRSSALDVIRADFVRTARSKGLSQNVIMYKHVLRNSLIPVVTISGALVAGVLTGSFVIELIFAVPGMAKHFIQSVTNRDYPMVLGFTLLFSVLLIFCNLVRDLLYAIVDPRIKLS